MVPFRHQSREETVPISETARLAEEGSGSRRTERLRCTRSRVPVPRQHDNVSAREVEAQQNNISRIYLNAGQSAPRRRKHRRALQIKHLYAGAIAVSVRLCYCRNIVGNAREALGEGRPELFVI